MKPSPLRSPIGATVIPKPAPASSGGIGDRLQHPVGAGARDVNRADAPAAGRSQRDLVRCVARDVAEPGRGRRKSSVRGGRGICEEPERLGSERVARVCDRAAAAAGRGDSTSGVSPAPRSPTAGKPWSNVPKAAAVVTCGSVTCAMAAFAAASTRYTAPASAAPAASTPGAPTASSGLPSG